MLSPLWYFSLVWWMWLPGKAAFRQPWGSPFSSKKNKLASEKIKNHCQTFNPFFSIFFFPDYGAMHISVFRDPSFISRRAPGDSDVHFWVYLYALSQPYLYVIMNHLWINHLHYCPRLPLPPLPFFFPHRKPGWIPLTKCHLVIKYFTKKFFLFCELWSPYRDLHLFFCLCKWIMAFNFLKYNYTQGSHSMHLLRVYFWNCHMKKVFFCFFSLMIILVWMFSFFLIW